MEVDSVDNIEREEHDRDLNDIENELNIMQAEVKAADYNNN